MLETRTETINGKEFIVTESILRGYQNEIIKKPFKYFVEKNTNKKYDGIAYDLVGYEKEYKELEEMLEQE